MSTKLLLCAASALSDRRTNVLGDTVRCWADTYGGSVFPEAYITHLQVQLKAACKKEGGRCMHGPQT